VNRTPPKTQAALLQAMQEHAVTVGGQSRTLEEPFMVLATQNPIEQEGTYPLPEAQLDRFMLSIPVGYPSEDEEVEVVRRTTTTEAPTVLAVVDRDTLLRAQGLIRSLPASRDVARYAVRLARATRPENGSDIAKRWVQWGASPRASQYLAIGARVRAALAGNEVPHTDDVRALAPAVLRHRLVLNFEAEASGVTPLQVVEKLLDEVPLR
jgi:MoxR-like ATPase